MTTLADRLEKTKLKTLREHRQVIRVIMSQVFHFQVNVESQVFYFLSTEAASHQYSDPSLHLCKMLTF